MAQIKKAFSVGNKPNETISLKDFGAVGDGVTDDTAAIDAAVTFAASNGLWLSGISTDIVYGYTGNLTLPDGIKIKKFHVKQLNPAGSTSRRTITSSSANNINLIDVIIDMNGDGTNGSTSDYAGVWLVGGTGHFIDRVRVTGDAFGRAFFMTGCSDFYLRDIHVHDVNYSFASDPGDDRINGINLQACTNFDALGLKASNLGGNFGAGQTSQYTRGLAVTGCENFNIRGYRADNVGQGSDLTGGINSGNVNFTYTNSQVTDCYSWGFKFANSSNMGTVGNLTARDCGLGSFVISGGSGGVAQPWISKEVSFANCKSINVGSSGNWPNPRGFSILQGDTDASTPFGVKYIDCQAIDESGQTASITGASQANPCVITTAASHDLSTGMYVKITGVVGMTELNADGTNNKIYKVTVLTPIS